MTTRKRNEDEEFDDEPIAKRVADAASMMEQQDVARPITFEDQAHWNRMFFELMLYRANYGNVNVKSTDEKYQGLYRWIVQLRKDYKIRERNPEESTLTADQIKTLESVRFAFTTRGEEHWQKNYEKLQEYKKEHGHVLVPRQCEIPGLGDWVTSQRQQYHEYVQGKPTPLTKQRKELLDEIGFQWRIRNRPEWTMKYEELIKYKEKHGDTRVPQHYSDNRALGKWVAKQREQYKLLKKGKHSFLTPDRLEKLNSIGFVWSVRGETIDDGPDVMVPPPKKEEEEEEKVEEDKGDAENSVSI
ncbi:helicase domain protein [Nitzschia inconspicua]|uniref:Helicase domain protein n=1 Tax=Nitzschia inconspicua TaxID=303405 RepID=A0A9K3KN30_9STRA|nr:helicase domain protein [Nitzschia inconspicua]